MSLRQLKHSSIGIIAIALPVTANIIGDSTGLTTNVSGLSWLAEPNVNYKLCSTAPTFATNTPRSKIQCRWAITGANGSFTTNPEDQTGFTAIGQEHVFALSANVAYYGFSAFEYVLAAGPTPTTYFSFGFQFWHDHNNVSGYGSVTPTMKAAADWPFLLWVEKM